MQYTRFKIFQTPENMVIAPITGGSGFNFRSWYLLVAFVLFSAMLPATQVYSAIIQQPITIDGNMNDWKSPADITSNPGQFSSDAEGDATTGSSADLDFPVQGTAET